MDTLDLLRDLEARRILIAAEGSRLHWRGPASAITPGVLAELKARKREILALLRVEAALGSRQWDGAHPVLGAWRAGVAAATNTAPEALIGAATRFLDGPDAVAAAQARWSTLEVFGMTCDRHPCGIVPFMADDMSITLVRIDKDRALLLDRDGNAFERPRAVSMSDTKPFWEVETSAL
jgi:hypothetical protein